jgi:hypothetical protein
MKVLGFDGWTVGSHHYRRLLGAFADRGLDLKLLHLGSWGNEKGRPTEEVIGGLSTRDISFHAGKTFREILMSEKPDAVVFLSTDAFAHRAFNRYCRQHGIPTVHLFHGLEQLMDILPPEPNAVRRLWRMRSHILKTLRHFLPVYTRSLWDTHASFVEWRRFAQDIAWRARAQPGKHSADDARADKACVYIDSEVRYAVERYGYLPADVIIVGNPDLLSFGIDTDSVGIRLDRSIVPTNEVVYIETALADYGAVYGSQQEFVRHIIETNSELRHQGKKLLLKVHPSTGASIRTELASADVAICSNDEFLPVLRRCCACITEPSSAALLPSLVGLPLFLANYGKLAGQAFGKLIESYPRARRLRDLRDFNSQLAAAERDEDLARAQAWIELHKGPQPPKQMPMRVADVIVGLVASAHTSVGGGVP